MELLAAQGKIVASLMLFIQSMTGTVGIDFQAPEIRVIPQSELARKACDGQACEVYGWFSNTDKLVYLADNQDFVNNPHARSILLHELVHYVQDQMKAPTMVNDCLTWKARELQAYDIQYEWLRRHRVRAPTPSFNAVLINFENVRCPYGRMDAEAAPPSTDSPAH